MKKHLGELLLISLIITGFCLGNLLPEYEDIGNVLAAILLLYWVVYILAKDDDTTDSKIAGFNTIILALRILLPFAAFTFTVLHYKFFHTTEVKKEPVIEVRQNVDPLKCSMIHYGLFKASNDTIERIKLNDADIEIHNHKDTFNIKWSDACSYMLTKPNGYVEVCKVIDIKADYYYIQVINSYMQRKYIMMKTIKNYTSNENRQ